MKKLFSIGLVRGLVFQIIGTGIGAGFVTGIRALMGLSYWAVDEANFGFTEPAWVVGGIFGVLFFLYGSRVMDDWLLWAKGEEPSEHQCQWKSDNGGDEEHVDGRIRQPPAGKQHVGHLHDQPGTNDVEGGCPEDPPASKFSDESSHRWSFTLALGYRPGAVVFRPRSTG